MTGLVPIGLCQCGCGQLAPVARATINAKGVRKGEPMRFIRGHNTRVRPKMGLQYLVDEHGCWLWQLGKTKGYGVMRHNGKTVYVHRLLYEERYGPVPRGSELDHVCRVPACVNPDHLEAVSHQQNTKRHHLAKPACPHGHPYDGANTYVNPKTGHRTCKRCRAEGMRRAATRRKQQP